MYFLRTLFWVLVAVALVIFGVQNNNAVTVNLWGGLQADVKLWLLVVAPFLLGFLPTWAFHRLSLWQQRRRAAGAAERAERSVVPSWETQTSITPDGTMVSHPGVSHPDPAAAAPGL